MRDGNRLKEKFELRFDQRQVVSFAVVALLLAGALFALGVMVGRNLAGLPGASASRQDALLDRLDAKAQLGMADAGGAPGTAPASDGLTFQEELTRRRPASPTPKPASVHPAVHAPAHSQVRPIAEKATPRPVPEAAPVEPVEPATPSQGAEPRASLATPAEANGASPLPPLAASPRATAPFFTVQIKATQSRPEADRFAAKLTAQGFHPFVAVVELPGRGRWYRVRVGHFESRAKADRYLTDFKREAHLEAFITVAGH